MGDSLEMRMWLRLHPHVRIVMGATVGLGFVGSLPGGGAGL
jgi:hypothetical protein